MDKSESESKMMLFWKNLSYEKQKAILEIQDIETKKTLFADLDIETIYETKIMHKKAFESIRLDLLDQQDVEWVNQFKFYEKFGATVDYELNRDKFIEKLKQD